MFEGTLRSALVTDERGRVSFEARPGESLKVSADGFRDATLQVPTGGKDAGAVVLTPRDAVLIVQVRPLGEPRGVSLRVTATSIQDSDGTLGRRVLDRGEVRVGDALATAILTPEVAERFTLRLAGEGVVYVHPETFLLEAGEVEVVHVDLASTCELVGHLSGVPGGVQGRRIQLTSPGAGEGGVARGTVTTDGAGAFQFVGLAQDARGVALSVLVSGSQTRLAGPDAQTVFEPCQDIGTVAPAQHLVGLVLLDVDGSVVKGVPFSVMWETGFAGPTSPEQDQLVIPYDLEADGGLQVDVPGHGQFLARLSEAAPIAPMQWGLSLPSFSSGRLDVELVGGPLPSDVEIVLEPTDLEVERWGYPLVQRSRHGLRVSNLQPGPYDLSWAAGPVRCAATSGVIVTAGDATEITLSTPVLRTLEGVVENWDEVSSLGHRSRLKYQEGFAALEDGAFDLTAFEPIGGKADLFVDGRLFPGAFDLHLGRAGDRLSATFLGAWGPVRRDVMVRPELGARSRRMVLYYSDVDGVPLSVGGGPSWVDVARAEAGEPLTVLESAGGEELFGWLFEYGVEEVLFRGWLGPGEIRGAAAVGLPGRYVEVVARVPGGLRDLDVFVARADLSGQPMPRVRVGSVPSAGEVRVWVPSQATEIQLTDDVETVALRSVSAADVLVTLP